MDTITKRNAFPDESSTKYGDKNSDEKEYISPHGVETDDELSTTPSFEFESSEPTLIKLEVEKYEKDFDLYRLPLEVMTFSEQLMQSSDWFNSILTRPKLRINEEFLSDLEAALEKIQVDWENEIQIVTLISIISPKANEAINYHRESICLLIFTLLLWIKYRKCPDLRYKIKHGGCLAIKSYLKILKEEKLKQDNRKLFSWKNIKFYTAMLLMQIGVSLMITKLLDG